LVTIIYTTFIKGKTCSVFAFLGDCSFPPFYFVTEKKKEERKERKTKKVDTPNSFYTLRKVKGE